MAWYASLMAVSLLCVPGGEVNHAVASHWGVGVEAVQVVPPCPTGEVLRLAGGRSGVFTVETSDGVFRVSARVRTTMTTARTTILAGDSVREADIDRRETWTSSPGQSFAPDGMAVRTVRRGERMRSRDVRPDDRRVRARDEVTVRKGGIELRAQALRSGRVGEEITVRLLANDRTRTVRIDEHELLLLPDLK